MTETDRSESEQFTTASKVYRSGGGRLVQIGGSSEDLTLSLALRSCSDAGEGTGR